MKTTTFLTAALLHATSLAQTVTVVAPQATIVGYTQSGIDNFLGIPFAVPPVGPLRLTKPQALNGSLGLVNATQTPQECPQFQIQTQGNATALQSRDTTSESATAAASISPEDCLTLNVQRPATATAGSKLPVVFWIFGGGFEFGSTNAYNASNLIANSVQKGNPIMYVAVNYRIGGFGFLAGQEVQDAGVSNLGLLDQRLGMQWVADNIEAFGGDPTKVTIWGESAGSISVWDQMALYDGNNTYKGKPLFRAAVMDSGSITPSNPVNCTKAQNVYDTVVHNANCSSATDTLACLRSQPYETFYNAANSVPAILGYNSVALSYMPRQDGVVLTDSPELIAQAGHYTQIPFILGDQEDEGTLFATAQRNLTTTADVVDYLHTIFFPDFPRARIAGLVHTYPNRSSAGSPFGTGSADEIYPQYKRLSAILGDISFTLTRRAFLAINRNIRPSTPAYSYLATYLHGMSSLGTYHGSDTSYAYGDLHNFAANSTMNYYLSFFNTMDPNAQIPSDMTPWPLWDDASNVRRYGNLINLGATNNTILGDRFRNESYTYLVSPENVLRI